MVTVEDVCQRGMLRHTSFEENAAHEVQRDPSRHRVQNITEYTTTFLRRKKIAVWIDKKRPYLIPKDAKRRLWWAKEQQKSR